MQIENTGRDSTTVAQENQALDNVEQGKILELTLETPEQADARIAATMGQIGENNRIAEVAQTVDMTETQPKIEEIQRALGMSTAGNSSEETSKQIANSEIEDVNLHQIEEANQEADMRKIADYERNHNVSQDQIAQTFIVRGTMYPKLIEKLSQAQEHFDSLRSNGDSHPDVLEAKKQWNDAADEANRASRFLVELMDNMTPKTKELYRKDMLMRGVIRE